MSTRYCIPIGYSSIQDFLLNYKPLDIGTPGGSHLPKPQIKETMVISKEKCLKREIGGEPDGGMNGGKRSYFERERKSYINPSKIPHPK